MAKPHIRDIVLSSDLQEWNPSQYALIECPFGWRPIHGKRIWNQRPFIIDDKEAEQPSRVACSPGRVELNSRGKFRHSK